MKNPDSVRESLAYIIKIHDEGRKFFVKTLDGQLLGRNCKAIIDAQTNRLRYETQVIE